MTGESSRDAAEWIKANAAFLLAQTCPTGRHVGSVHARIGGGTMVLNDPPAYLCGCTDPRRSTEPPGIREQIEALRLDEPISDADDAAWNRALDAVMELLGGSTETPRTPLDAPGIVHAERLAAQRSARARDRVEVLARWLHEHDSEGAFTWESTADEWREQARELLAFLESLDA